MRSCMSLTLSLASLLWCVPASAHGGTYRGPGDVVPDGPRPPGPGPRTPNSPNQPGPRTPSTPSTPTTPQSPGTKGTGPTTPNGPGPQRGLTGPTTSDLPEDLTRWQFWWEFNKDPFLRLKRAIHDGGLATGDDPFFNRDSPSNIQDRIRPGDREIAIEVVPRLLRTLDESHQRDIVSSCMVALAKIGMEEEGVLRRLRTRLPDGDQEVAETAALAMGILASPKGLPDLVSLASDTAAGRELCQRPGGVNYRTRAFAIYGLGLIANAHKDLELKRRVYETLRPMLEAPRLSSRDLRVAAIHGLRLLRLDPTEGPAAATLLQEVLGTLSTYYRAGRSGEELAQSHVPGAVARLLGPTAVDKGPARDLWLNDLATRKSDWIRQSTALALGGLARPEDEAACKALREHADHGRDAQSRYFALMALGQIGGELNRGFLLRTVESGRQQQDKAWASLALGVMNFRLRQADANAEIDSAAGALIARQLRTIRNPDVLGAMAIALGLLGYRPAADDVLAVLRERVRDDELCGYCCLALGLMQHRPARDEIRGVVEESVRRPDRLKQAAVGLGLLGDHTATDVLLRLLKDNSSLAAVSAVAGALGTIGDARTLRPLGEMLGRNDLSDNCRAFAAVALGIVADKEEFPWNSKIAMDINYRAATETLTDSAGGILDIL